MKKYKNCIPFLILMLTACALIIRAFYGFCQSDEAFYISTAKRLFEGDRIFIDEWFPTQLSGVIILPFYALFVSLAKSTVGIILYFRLLYILISFLISCDAYMILHRKYSETASLCAALFMLLFAHLNIGSMSYYTMSFEFFIFSMLLISMHSGRGYISGGFFFALAVLSLPSLVIAFTAAFFVLLICSVKFKSLRSPLIYVISGILITSAAFTAYLYASGNSIPDLFRYLPYILEDEEHQTSLVAPFRLFFTAVTDVFWYAPYITLLLSIVCFFSHCFRKFRPYLFAADAILFIWYFCMSIGHTGYISTAFTLFALPVFCMNDKKDWYSFLALFIGGLCVSMTYSYSSNAGLYVLTIGHSIACIAGILFIDESVKENPSYVRYICITVLAVFLFQTALLRFVNVYRDAPLKKLDTKITDGPACGLYTTSSHASQYSGVLSDIRSVSSDSDGYIFFTKLLPWGYLASGMHCGAPTTWRTKLNSRRLEEYYNIHPEKIPDVVIVLNANIGAYDDCGDVEADPYPNKNEPGGWLGSYIDSGKYKKAVRNTCTVYTCQE